jgi:hypothetical protein
MGPRSGSRERNLRRPVLSGNGQVKPWYGESFRAPSDPQQREALCGPVVKTWMTPEGAQCKDFEDRTHVCDNPNGVTYVEVKKDRVMWLQYPDRSKEWLIPPSNVPRSK